MIKDLLDQAIIEITTLKGPSLVVAFIIMLGYCLKMVPKFPNRYIPLMSFLVGILLTPIMVSWPTPGSMPSDVRWPEAAAWATSLCMGLLLACIAWIMHAQVLRRLIDNKVPALAPGRKVDKTTTEEVHSDALGTTKTVEKTATVTETPTTDQTKPAIEEALEGPDTVVEKLEKP